MTSIDHQQKKWLRETSKAAIRALLGSLRSESIRVTSLRRVSVGESNADGWYVQIGKIRGYRPGVLKIWLDRWPQSRSRVLSICYEGSDADKVNLVSRAGAKNYGRPVRVSGRIEPKLGVPLMPRRLPQSEWRKPVLELYANHNCYYGEFIPLPHRLTKETAQRMARRAAHFLGRVAGAVVGLRDQLRIVEEVFPAVEDRRLVAAHLRRERSRRLVRAAKIRDGFTCQICDINFERLYGRLGRGFAEAHHLVLFGRPNKPIRISLDDLVTVCANCHRMIHRMTGKRSDVARLRRVFTRAWPRGQHRPGRGF